jgi:class 3 adenylate cyclase/predicted ATPase
VEIAAWLRELGLERYEEAFRDNEIDAEILPTLTADDLKDLGVTLVGHRRKLLNAIASLGAIEPVASTEPQSIPPAQPVTTTPVREAERRQLTVMFVDLVGSTALAGRLDPEDTRDVFRAYQDACAGVITRFEGHLAKFMGDGVLAYFGWPRAHEDDAERAIRAGLTLAETVGQLAMPGGGTLAARVGIATGLVVVGDLIGEGTSQEEAVVGDTPNLAARLQTLAEPGQVVISEATRRLSGDVFDLADLGRKRVKGVAEPVGAFAVLGERRVESRFEARRGQVLPMVGRDQELALLLERWDQAKVGEGQGVLLVGEAGIGKSRIGRALIDAVAEELHTRIRYQCSPYHRDSALWPVVQQLTHAAGIVSDDATDARLDKLETLLARANGAADTAPLITDLLGLDAAARYGELSLTPQAQRARTLQVLVDQLVGLASRQPVLMLLEDAHWIDPTTLELIEQCLDQIADRRVLILLTSRPDHQPELVAHPHVTRLTLNRLGRAGVEAIVARLGGDQLPSETIDAIIARTDGVPLFVEELTKAVLETGDASIPASLHDSLMARLDRIPEVKEVAQIAACIGREFNFSLLAAVAGRPDADLSTALDRLARSELIFRRGTPPDASYTFKHALVQDAAHQSLLRSKRQELHARIASELKEQFSEWSDAEPEVLAHHYGLADNTEKACQYWLEAGRRAAERSANVEAIQHLIKARDYLATLPNNSNNSERVTRELDVLMTLGPAFTATRGFAAVEVEETYGRVRELCRLTGQVDESRAALQALRVLYMVRGNLSAADELGQELLTLGEQQNSLSHQCEGHLALGIVDEFRGRLVSSRSHLEKALLLFDSVGLGTLVRQPTGDLAVTCLGHLGNVLFLTGLPEQSLKRSREALDIARASSHPYSLAQALGSTGITSLLRRPLRDSGNAAALVELADEQGFDFWYVWGMALRGWAYSETGQTEAGLADLRYALAAAEAMGAELVSAQALATLAATLGRIGRVQEALPLLAEQQQLALRTGIAVYDAPVRLLEGELRLQLPEHDLARVEACFRDALAIARQQESKILELRAATALARLWAGQEVRQKAYDLLAPIYGWFTEGFDTADLKDAEALLAELA